MLCQSLADDTDPPNRRFAAAPTMTGWLKPAQEAFARAALHSPAGCALMAADQGGMVMVATTMKRRDFLGLAGAALISSPNISFAQTAPRKKLRIVVITNRYHEADGLMAAVCNQMKQSPNLSYPYKVVSPQAPSYPPPPQNSVSPRCLIDVKNKASDAAPAATMEIWCIDDLVNAKGDSTVKAKAMAAVTNYGAYPDGVIAFGTAGYPDIASNDGCATIGGTIFIHDAAKDVTGYQGGTWAWPNKPENMGALVPSKTPASFFSGVAGDQNMLKAIGLEMIAPQRAPAGVLQLICAPDAVGISSVNIPDLPANGASAAYCGIDTTAINLAKAKGATNITSVETTHGVIRSMWEDAPFIYVTAIPNRVCHFPDEASQIYGQEFPSSHNAGIALKYVIPNFVSAIA
jgi:hypothetical protein